MTAAVPDHPKREDTPRRTDRTAMQPPLIAKPISSVLKGTRKVLGRSRNALGLVRTLTKDNNSGSDPLRNATAFMRNGMDSMGNASKLLNYLTEVINPSLEATRNSLELMSFLIEFISSRAKCMRNAPRRMHFTSG